MPTFALPGRALLLAAAVALCGRAAAEGDGAIVRLSIVGTTDLHGSVFARDGRGGLALLGGYLANLRAARAADGGAVVLVDSGDTFQAGIESNLSEGAIVVDAYAALGYDAAAIGNHEFDFGPVDGAGARQSLGSDPLGAIKAAARRAPFPLLAANLLDASTGRVVDWPNVRPAVIVEKAGVKVGILGVMSIDALRATLPVHVRDLRVAPLAAAVEAQAAKLRAAGAVVVVVAAHAGGACSDFGDPLDVSSCDQSSEIFTLARALPRGLVDAIAAGHTHQAVAHEVAGIAIVQAYSHGRAFGRVDLTVDKASGRVVSRQIFAPQEVCAAADSELPECGPAAESATDFVKSPRPTRYEGRVVAADAAVAVAMAPELEQVRRLQAAKLGVTLDSPILRAGDGDSALGNLFADAQRERTRTDVAINNNVRGGLRADLPAGELTFGALYDAFPFDNRLVTVVLTAAELRAVLAGEARRNRPGALALSGVRARAGCAANGDVAIELTRDSGAPLPADERVVVAAMDSLVAGGVFAAVRPPAGFGVPAPDAPVMREVVEDWLRERGGHLDARAFADPAQPRFEYAADLAGCLAP